MSVYDWLARDYAHRRESQESEFGCLEDYACEACAYFDGAASFAGLMGMAHAIHEREREKAIAARTQWGLRGCTLGDT